MTREDRAEWIASMLNDQCNCLNGTLDHTNCLTIIGYRRDRPLTGKELLDIIDDGIEEEGT